MRRFFHASLWIAAVGAAVATFGGYYELTYPPSDEEATIFVPIFLIGGSFIFFCSDVFRFTHWLHTLYGLVRKAVKACLQRQEGVSASPSNKALQLTAR